jgi:hypothetical protein
VDVHAADAVAGDGVTKVAEGGVVAVEAVFLARLVERAAPLAGTSPQSETARNCRPYPILMIVPPPTLWISGCR